MIGENIINKEARFYPITGFLTSKDHLYLPEDYVIRVKLEKIEIIDKNSGEKKQLNIYPYRSIEMRVS